MCTIQGLDINRAGTKLAKRLARDDKGINLLDAACKEHDIAYSQNRENIEERNNKDRVLADKAWQRVKAKDSCIDEKVATYAITNIMKAKSKLGMGVKRKQSTRLSKIIIAASKSILKVILLVTLVLVLLSRKQVETVKLLFHGFYLYRQK